MENDRIIDLGEDLRSHVFDILDQEIEMTGMDAGRVAQITEAAFVAALQAIHNQDQRALDQIHDNPLMPK